MTASFTYAVHMLGQISWQEKKGMTSTSFNLANCMNVAPETLRKLLSQLSKAGLVKTRRGTGGGIWLAKAATDISLRDVYEAVASDEEVITRHPNPTNKTCDFSAHVRDVLQQIYAPAEEAMLDELATVSVADFAVAVTAPRQVPAPA